MLDRTLVWPAFLLAMLSAPSASPPLANGDSARYAAPVETPASHYTIDARVDPDTGVVEGRETIQIHNRSSIPLTVLALEWDQTEGASIEVTTGGKPLSLRPPETDGPIWMALPAPIAPGGRLSMEARFRHRSDVTGQENSFSTSEWHPRLWWSGLPHHNSYSVKIESPPGHALTASGRLDERTGRFEAQGVRTFGLYLGRGMKVASRDAGGVRVTALFSDDEQSAATTCLDTAVDAIAFYREWLDFYPYPFLSIVPGDRGGRWGGYPMATGIVAIHGLGTHLEGESPQHWQHITSHEIGHQYWGEWVLDGDRPSWLWIAMGIYADTEYMTTRGFDPERGAKWRQNYLRGISAYYEMPLEVTPADLKRIAYDRNNVVVHSKGPALLSAVEVAIGKPAFLRVYRELARGFRGRPLSWRDLQRACEAETGESLAWLFEPWVRSNAYLSYAIESRESRPEADGFRSTVRVRRRGTLGFPVPVKAVFEDGQEEVKRLERTREVDTLAFRSRTPLRHVILDPEHKLALVEQPPADIGPEAAAALAWGWRRADSLRVYDVIRSEPVRAAEIWYRLGSQLYETDRYDEALDCFSKAADGDGPPNTRFAAVAWLGIVEDVRGNRAAAVAHYRDALARDIATSVRVDVLATTIDRTWLHERLTEPFRMESRLALPDRPTADELVRALEQLRWRHEGCGPLSIYRKTDGLALPRAQFWLKLGLLLFDSGQHDESLVAFERAAAAQEASALARFAAWTWIGHLNDLGRRREEALASYRRALELDPGGAMQHSQYDMVIDRRWVERRLRTPFTWDASSLPCPRGNRGPAAPLAEP